MFEGDVPKKNQEARRLVWALYGNAADDDYIAARFFSKARMPWNFYWSAQQSIEKMLKATLLLNGIKTKKGSHTLTKRLSCAKEICGDLLPEHLVPHSALPEKTNETGFPEMTADFVQRVETEGDPNNRYRHYGVSFHQSDLYKLDELYFALRRTAWPLEKQCEKLDCTHRERLRREPNLQVIPFASLAQTRQGELGFTEREAAFKWQNFSFCEQSALAEGVQSAGDKSYSNSPISYAANSGVKGHEAVEWIEKMAYFCSDDRNDILATLADSPWPASVSAKK